jgi:hypothetical protein
MAGLLVIWGVIKGSPQSTLAFIPGADHPIVQFIWHYTNIKTWLLPHSSFLKSLSFYHFHLSQSITELIMSKSPISPAGSLNSRKNSTRTRPFLREALFKRHKKRGLNTQLMLEREFSVHSGKNTLVDCDRKLIVGIKGTKKRWRLMHKISRRDNLKIFPAKPPRFENLPYELQVKVILRIPPEDFLNCRRISHSWKSIWESDSILALILDYRFPGLRQTGSADPLLPRLLEAIKDYMRRFLCYHDNPFPPHFLPWNGRELVDGMELGPSPIPPPRSSNYIYNDSMLAWRVPGGWFQFDFWTSTRYFQRDYNKPVAVNSRYLVSESEEWL